MAEIGLHMTQIQSARQLLAAFTQTVADIDAIGFVKCFERKDAIDSAVEPVARPTKVRKMCEKIEKLSRWRTHPYGER